ncbi:hypothetical protein [Nocardioides convexus]|uniref:hypothetical protein n=1 Tax=Nocardioides convexus TaxID=2712224 RepID=UPI003100D5CA
MGDFDDLLKANQDYAETFDQGGFDGKAHAGVAIVTCMDSRIDPLRMLGLSLRRREDLPQPGRPGHRGRARGARARRAPAQRRPHPGDPAHPLRDGGEHRGRDPRQDRRRRGPRRHLARLPRHPRPEEEPRRGRPQGPLAPAHPRVGQGRRLHLRRRHGPALPGGLSAAQTQRSRSTLSTSAPDKLVEALTERRQVADPGDQVEQVGGVVHDVAQRYVEQQRAVHRATVRLR